MRRNIFSPPDEFSLSPLLTLLPIKGKAARLAALTSSLFARFEKVSGLLSDEGAAGSPEHRRRYIAEEAMLKQVLEWLEVKPGK